MCIQCVLTTLTPILCPPSLPSNPTALLFQMSLFPTCLPFGLVLRTHDFSQSIQYGCELRQSIGCCGAHQWVHSWRLMLSGSLSSLWLSREEQGPRCLSTIQVCVMIGPLVCRPEAGDCGCHEFVAATAVSRLERGICSPSPPLSALKFFPPPFL